MKKCIIILTIILITVAITGQAATVLFPYQGGTGTGTVPTSGQLLIGNTGGTYTVASLTAGANITITPGSGSITIASTGAGSGDVTSVGDCTDGACLDGTSDGGTYIKFYDAQGAGQLINGNLTGVQVWTMPDATGTVALTTSNVSTATALAANPADCGAGTAATAIAANGDLTCGITPLISGGTLTTGYHCRYDGTGIDCDRLEDATGACATNSVCMGGHNHGVTDLSWANDWMMAYSNGTGLQELAIGGANTYLMSNGESAPTWTASDGSGTCTASSVCIGGHTHPTTEISGVNAGTDLTADLEEDVHCAEHDSTDVDCSGETITVVDDQHNHTTTTISGLDISADTNLTAGRSLTLTDDDVLADAELYTDTKCIYIEDPVAADDLKSLWFAKTAATITSLWCESDQTVTAMLQVDDGSAADVDSVDLTCDTTPPEDTSLDGDATMASGDRLDLDIASVASTPTWVSICWTFTYDD